MFIFSASSEVLIYSISSSPSDTNRRWHSDTDNRPGIGLIDLALSALVVFGVRARDKEGLKFLLLPHLHAKRPQTSSRPVSLGRKELRRAILLLVYLASRRPFSFFLRRPSHCSAHLKEPHVTLDAKRSMLDAAVDRTRTHCIGISNLIALTQLSSAQHAISSIQHPGGTCDLGLGTKLGDVLGSGGRLGQNQNGG